jgi:undecaprenyl pyrophosphate phosphatase UppP
LNQNTFQKSDRRDELFRLSLALVIYLSPIYFIGMALDHNHALYKVITVVAASWSVIGIFLSYYVASAVQECISGHPETKDKEK